MSREEMIDKIVEMVEDWDIEALERYAKEMVRNRLDEADDETVSKEYKFLTEKV